MSINVFCWINAIHYQDENDTYFPYIEEHGFWIEMPAIMPIGTALTFKWPNCYEDESGFYMEIEKYEIRINGDIICRLNSPNGEHGYLEITGSREEILNDMATVGLVDYYANERVPNAKVRGAHDELG